MVWPWCSKNWTDPSRPIRPTALCFPSIPHYDPAAEAVDASQDRSRGSQTLIGEQAHGGSLHGSRRSSARRIPARRITPSNGCWAIARASSACRCAFWRARSMTRSSGLRGPSVVALVTGEERIVPPRTQYWVCTVEAMPEGMGVDFLAIDEIQLCADPERGHVFTDRLLRSRGLHETLFLGSDTMRGTIAALVPRAQFMRRERMSKLTYTGSKKISRMPARSAIVGFSVDNVYAIAELIRRQKGGAAVVMGALSPAHPQRAGRALSERRCGLPGGHRCHRHGAEPRYQPRRLFLADQIRRAADAASGPQRTGPDRRPRRARHGGRHLRRDRRGRTAGRRGGRGDHGSSLHARSANCNGATTRCNSARSTR